MNIKMFALFKSIRILMILMSRDFNFCITAIELIYDVSFLKILQLIVDGDIEVHNFFLTFSNFFKLFLNFFKLF